MQLIIVNGPSGSGKTRLSKKILKKLKYGIILNTDNYYKTGIISKIFAKLIKSYFDRKISFNFNLFKRDLEFILKNGFSNFYYKYDFKKRKIQKILKKTKKIKFIIIEGIFGKEIFKFLSSEHHILITLKINKKTCMRRVIKRDFIKRGKSKNLAKKDFIKAWDLFYNNKKNKNSNIYLKEIVIRNNNDISNLIKKITKIVN